MELGIASPNEKEKMQIKQYQAQVAPLAPQEKGMVGQMGDMVKQRAMEGALDKGQSALMGAIPSAGAANAAMLSSTPATMGMAGPSLGAAASGAGAGAGMAALGTAVPYVGAGLLAGKALGLFNEGGMVGPLSPQYNAEGTMSKEQAMALMNNQPDPDQLYNEIMTEAVQGQMPQYQTMPPTQKVMPMVGQIPQYQVMPPTMPSVDPLSIDPLGADTTYSDEMYKSINT